MDPDISPQGDYEDLTQMRLSQADIDDLVGVRGQCVFNWTTRDGFPVGVVVAYLYKEGTFWTTCAAKRKRVPALRARPQSGIVVERAGKTASFKGESTVHGPGDEGWETLSTWFYDGLSQVDRRPDDAGAHSFRSLLDSPHRVIIETPARLVVGFDGDRFMQVTQAAIAAGMDRS